MLLCHVFEKIQLKISKLLASHAYFFAKVLARSKKSPSLRRLTLPLWDCIPLSFQLPLMVGWFWPFSCTSTGMLTCLLSSWAYSCQGHPAGTDFLGWVTASGWDKLGQYLFQSQVPTLGPTQCSPPCQVPGCGWSLGAVGFFFWGDSFSRVEVIIIHLGTTVSSSRLPII